MIITAQPFFDEVDLMLIKCRELAGLVDAHVIVEANLTYTGQPKPYYFDEARDRFADFPIIHHKIELPPNNPDGTHMPAWDREDIQRKELSRIVKMLHPEVVFYTDVDETPRMSTLARFRQMKIQTARMEMDDLRYFFNRCDRTSHWHTPYVTLHDPKADWPPGFHNEAHPIISAAGWHFCFMGGRDQILKSVRAISHAEEECGIEYARKVEAGELPDLARTTPYPIELLPECIRANPQDYAAYFAK